MSNAALVQDETEDRYFTQVEEGDVRLFTLDQLDAAFNAGLIHENTYVCLEGDSKWLTLAEVAGLSDEEEPVSAPQLVAAPVAQFVAPAPPRAPAPVPQAHYTAESAYPPVISAQSIAPAPYSVAPMVMPRSIAPVSNDLGFDDDMDMMAMRPKRRGGKIAAGLAALTLIGVVVAVVQSGGIRLPKLNLGEGVGQASAASLSLSNLKQAEPTKAATPVAEVAEVAKPEQPKAEEAKPAEPAADTSAKKGDDRFSEEMKAALLNKDKDKKSASKKTAKKTARGAIASHKGGGKAKGSAGFKSGGSAYDPLNGKL